MTLLGAAEIRSIAAQLDLKPAKALGQNFVIDANVCRKIVRTAGITATDIALEIGPGLGSLTLALMEEAASVVAVEIDTRLANQLPITAAAHSDRAHLLTVLNQDALQLLAKDIQATLPHVSIVGLMGMASFTENKIQIETEFKKLSTLHQNFVKQHPQLTVLSMGMSSDYTLALDHGSTMVRIGSSIFGARNYN